MTGCGLPVPENVAFQNLSRIEYLKLDTTHRLLYRTHNELQ